MKRVGAPFDEEREQAALVVLEVETLPLEELAVGALTRPGPWAQESDARVAKKRRKFLEVAGMHGPTNQMRRAQFFKVRKCFDGKLLDMVLVLLWVRRNDFEIAAFAEREECVASAAAGMDAARCGADASALLDEVDAEVEVIAAEENMIELRRNLGGGRCYQRDARCSSYDCDKRSAANRVHR